SDDVPAVLGRLRDPRGNEASLRTGTVNQPFGERGSAAAAGRCKLDVNLGRLEQPHGRRGHLRVLMVGVAVNKELYLARRRIERDPRPAASAILRREGLALKRRQRTVSRDAKEPLDHAARARDASSHVGERRKRASDPIEQVGPGKDALTEPYSVFQVVLVL